MRRSIMSIGAPSPARSVRTQLNRVGLAMALLGALALLVSPFLSWADFDFVVGTVSKTGIDAGDGWITVVLALAVAAAVVWGWRAGPARVTALALGAAGILAAALTAVELATVRDRFGDVHRTVQGAVEDITGGLVSADPVSKSIGGGLYISAAGALLVLAGALTVGVAVRRRR
jgi:hypothetical protein